jgi:hypothetical protein
MKQRSRDRTSNQAKRESLRARNTRALPERAAATARNVQILGAAFRTLFADENFLTLLEAETLTEIPVWLKPILEQARQEHEIGK